MKRSELQDELNRVRKHSEHTYMEKERQGALAAETAILRHYDETQAELGYVQSLRSTISGLIEDNVAKDVRIQTLEAQLRAALDRTGEEDDDD